MTYRNIDKEQALKVLAILQDECGLHEMRERDEELFAMSIAAPHHYNKHPCSEYRFMGALGFGGKFRNNGNRDNTPYVDCYGEDLSPERKIMIDRANGKLAVLFPPDGE